MLKSFNLADQFFNVAANGRGKHFHRLEHAIGID
jgi:hypothetical protein